MWPAAVLFDVPPITVEGLWVSGAFGIVDTTLQHKVELMFADSCDCHIVVRES